MSYCWWKKSCTSWKLVCPTGYRVPYIPGGDCRSSETSTVAFLPLLLAVNMSTCMCWLPLRILMQWKPGDFSLSLQVTTWWWQWLTQALTTHIRISKSLVSQIVRNFFFQAVWLWSWHIFWSLLNINQHHESHVCILATLELLYKSKLDLQTSWTNTSVMFLDISTAMARFHKKDQERMWTNPGEIPDNGIDDDGDCGEKLLRETL